MKRNNIITFIVDKMMAHFWMFPLYMALATQFVEEF